MALILTQAKSVIRPAIGYTSSFRPSPFGEQVLRKGKMIESWEAPAQMVERMIETLFMVEQSFGTSRSEILRLASEFGRFLDERRCVMSTPIMTNAGRYHERPLSACTVPPVDLRRSRKSISKLIGRFHEDGMGTGFNFDDTDDPVSVLQYLNNLAVSGALGGREDRPVGNMGILSVYHPRVLEFIRTKIGGDARSEDWKFNISIDVDDVFMDAAARGKTYRRWDGSIRNARMVLEEIARSAHDCGDPGLVSIARLNRDNPTPGVGRYVSTAPCGEVGLAPGESCQFGYINLGMCLRRSAGRTMTIDYDLLERVTRLMTRALDNALEVSIDRYAHPVNRWVMRAKRKIGVGVCGLADMLVRMGIPYGSVKAHQAATDAVGFINFVSKLESHALAAQRGSFLAMNRSSGCRYLANPGYLEFRYGMVEGGGSGVTGRMWQKLGTRIRETRMLRNASTIALPPTGRSGLVINASTGVEPLFSLVNPDGALNDSLKQDLADHGLLANGTVDAIQSRGTLSVSDGISGELRRVYRTALEIEPFAQLVMVQSIQSVVDEAISKTINLPNESTPEDILYLYLKGYRLGLKGITVFRTGSRSIQPRKVVQHEANSRI